MEGGSLKGADLHPKAGPAKHKRARRARQQPEEATRYFLSKDGSSMERPELGIEVASEAEALIQSFQAKNSLIYAVRAFRAEAEIERGSPTLVKRALER